ncbi:hypothetical protein QNO07_14625 [Streptomyces sp. 549]|uniref:hypothetical protein n=1 Tax=Streptomyces sp. 549 TaxID=3049076 RepID=UPI0024C2C9E5|nr:hypothetical protein [Streptomyces sp. 549]MDK1474639.1 hypothetical protein [Streptomyces sp. 549]
MLRDTGALAEVERMIEDRLRTALLALDAAPFPDHVRVPLRTLARSSYRNS